jgi:TRAP-type C4-dicarboxylate transport system substrate-binding protein
MRSYCNGRGRKSEQLKQRRQREQLQVIATTIHDRLYAFANSPELAAAMKSINAFAAGPVWKDLARVHEAISKSPFMQAMQAFAKNPEAKRLAQWTNGEITRRSSDGPI